MDVVENESSEFLVLACHTIPCRKSCSDAYFKSSGRNLLYKLVMRSGGIMLRPIQIWARRKREIEEKSKENEETRYRNE